MHDPIDVLNRLRERAKLPANREIKGIDIDPPAAALVHDLDQRQHAFLLGCIPDRQILASRAWELPWHLRGRIGGFESTGCAVCRRRNGLRWSYFVGQSEGKVKVDSEWL